MPIIAMALLSILLSMLLFGRFFRQLGVLELHVTVHVSTPKISQMRITLNMRSYSSPTQQRQE